MLLISIIKLLEAWKAGESIDRIYDHSSSLQEEDFKDIDQWLDHPKLTIKEKNIYAELYIQLYTKYTTF